MRVACHTPGGDLRTRPSWPHWIRCRCQRSRLEVHLQNGLVEIDNNWCEGGMRPLALGRKNWLHLGSAEAGPKVAAIASIIETCRRLDINLREYLTEVLPKLGSWSINRVAELTPTAWKAAKARQN